MNRLIPASLVLVILLVAAPSACAQAPVPLEATAANAERAVELVLADRRVQNRLDLWRDAEPAPAVADFSSSPEPDLARMGTRWMIEFHDESSDGPRFYATIDPETSEVTVQGGGLVVMPGERSIAIDHMARWWVWLPFSLAFLVCVACAPAAGAGRLLLLPLVGVSAAFVLTFLNLVPHGHVRSGNLLLLGLAFCSLVAGAAAWWRASRRAIPTGIARGRWQWWAALAFGASMLLVVGIASLEQPIDVALATHYGAFLMREGQPVYGNTVDFRNIVSHADTYGPVTYMPYIPGSFLSDRAGLPALWTGVILALVGAGVIALAVRSAGRGTMAWSAAAWLTCPPVSIGVVVGNNDVLVGALVAATILALNSPLLRGVFVALAAGAKFLPLIALPAVACHDRNRRSARVTVATAAVTLVVVFAIGLRGIGLFDEFWDRAIVFQMRRTPLESVWGLMGVPRLRYIVLAGAAALAVASLRTRRGDVVQSTCLLVASATALVIASLPHYWGTYVTWLVPPVLVAICVPRGTHAAAQPETGDSSAVMPGAGPAPRASKAMTMR